MWRAGQPHGHFRVQVGYGFLGVLERFAADDDGAGERTYRLLDGGPTGRPAGSCVPRSGPAGWSR